MASAKIVGLTLGEIERKLYGYGFNTDYAQEICRWIYKRRCTSFLQMDTLPLDLRQKFEAEFSLALPFFEQVQVSSDGTKKYLFKTVAGNPFETAFMPGEKRRTICLSTQSGCNVGCSFCYTGSMGVVENLSVNDILAQIFSIPEHAAINRLVLMGMGEPLHNPAEVFKALEILNAQWGLAFGSANITLSTVGILPMLGNLVDSQSCNVAISLHSPFAEQRKKLIPAETENPIHSIVNFLMQNPVKKPLRLSFEYVVIPGVNDSNEHAAETAKLLANLNCHVNVIPLNTTREKPDNQKFAKEFQKKLNALGQPATLRVSRGIDIGAACGMMAGKCKLSE
jgi:23S rRNA (adenine2503-C2)-methyltransferase